MERVCCNIGEAAITTLRKESITESVLLAQAETHKLHKIENKTDMKDGEKERFDTLLVD